MPNRAHIGRINPAPLWGHRTKAKPMLPLRGTFKIHMHSAALWVGLAKSAASYHGAKIDMEIAINALKLALATANRMGDNGAKRVVMASLNKVRAQYRAAFV